MAQDGGIAQGHEFIKTDTPGVADPAAETGESGGAQDNTGGAQDNSGQEDDIKGFWGEPDGDGASNSSGKSSAADSTPQAQPAPAAQQPNAAEALQNTLSGLKFGESVMTDEVLTDMQAGNYEKFDARLQGMMQQGVKQALLLIAPMMQNQRTQIETGFGEQMKSQINQNADAEYLTDNIEFSSDPDIEPVAQGIYKQALNRSKGNRKEAVQLTKRFLAKISTQMAPELDLTVAPGTGQQSPNETVEDKDWDEFFL